MMKNFCNTQTSKDTRKNATQKIVFASLYAALICAVTIIIRIPSPFKGYLNLGDSVVILSGWMLSPLYAFLAAGIGSAMADVFSGYVVYAPATFVIKGLMAIAAFYLLKFLQKKIGKIPSKIFSGAVSVIIMVTGYFLFEGCLYGFGASAVNILPNALQGLVGFILALILSRVTEKIKFKI